MKTKVVQHVPRIKLDNQTTWQLDKLTTWQPDTFEHRHENKSYSACLKDQTWQLDNWTTRQLENFTGSQRLSDFQTFFYFLFFFSYSTLSQLSSAKIEMLFINPGKSDFGNKGSSYKNLAKSQTDFLGQPLSRLSAGSIQWNWKQTRFVLDIILYYRIPRHSVPYVTLFEINKRDVSEGSTFKKFDHTLVELSDNGIYQKVQP